MKRIVVVGTSCAGKSTLARQIAAKLKIKHIELDAIYWQQNWTPLDTTQFRERVHSLVQGESWTLDGNYSIVRDLVWDRATTIIWLNYPFTIIFWRGLKRTIRRVFTREDLWNNNRESARLAFFSWDSILLWIIRTHWKRQKNYLALFQKTELAHLEVIQLNSPREVNLFLSAF